MCLIGFLILVRLSFVGFQTFTREGLKERFYVFVFSARLFRVCHEACSVGASVLNVFDRVFAIRILKLLFRQKDKFRQTQTFCN